MSRSALVVALLFAATSCIENEEQIEIRPDGSVRVTLSAAGDARDLSCGYPLPLHGPWRPRGEETARWLAEVGADTGSAEVQAVAPTIDWQIEEDEEVERIELEVAAEFASVEDWPRWFAPAAEPYRTAYLRRSAELSIEERGGRTVYVFERTYHGRAHLRLNAQDLIMELLPPEVSEKLEAGEPLGPEEWRHVTDGAPGTYGDVAERFVRDACLGVYTEGDASLSPLALDRICARVRGAVVREVDLRPIIARYDLIAATPPDQRSDIPGPDPLEAMETRIRETTRDVLARALDREGVPEAQRNGILFALEWGFTAFDLASDLADEYFIVEVAMPGELVGGNYSSERGGRARWEFDGENLRDRDIVMRAVSVLN